jgi:hypothetical protein
VRTLALLAAASLLAIGCEGKTEQAAPKAAPGEAAKPAPAGKPDPHADHAAHAPSTTVTPPAPATAPAGNVVQAEMRLLLGAVHSTITAVASGDVGDVPDLWHLVHGAKETTAAALKDGSYQPRGGVEDFVARDEAFHALLETLVIAASKRDVDATAAALGPVMAGCNGCHTAHKPLPAPAP